MAAVFCRFMASTSPLARDPSKLFFQADHVRRSIISAYWLIIILALPLWWHTTSIERLSLPTVRVTEQTRHGLRIPVSVGLERDPDVSISASQLQNSVDALVRKTPQRWEGLDIRILETRSEDVEHVEGLYTVVSGNEVAVRGRELEFPIRGGPTISGLADTLGALIAPLASTTEQDHRVAQYSPHYRLSFTLLNEDAAAGHFYTEWDVLDAISRHISPILSQLETLHDFTIESQVQFHAPLAFSPRQINDGFGITPEDLTVFVNSAEWTLSSSASNDPVLHFVVFVPSAARRPLHILDSNGDMTSSTSFLLPQWGGIVILNPQEWTVPSKLPSSDLDPVFSAFSNHLLSLLGVPRLPPGVKNAGHNHHALTDWQLDALLRYRAMSNAQGSKDTLKSIVNLVNQIENMPVGQDVRGDIQGALASLEQMLDVSKTSLTETFRLSARAVTLSSRAFFNPGMLALLYFPAEHKYAVYTPLFASAVIPLFVAALRELASWRRQRKERARQVHAASEKVEGSQSSAAT
ncbi:putative phosphatidylinositol-glycan biosynthesis class S protein [Lyophyllum shimeji]|uniref:Phosphatidylinositol-glycan biosynthesis class S protein n=1 Tax=Lyophyllum shimeji TaxID=47721 RepID=A0A9P3URK6_LYOSH|nr:putative phosphatidylinositol-glycan biosynthesis class S protein [Lyophyllum shimeji]